MNEWATTFNNYKFIERLTQSAKFIDDVSIENVGEPYISRIARLKKAIILLIGYFNNIDPDLASQNIISQCQNEISNLHSHCQAYAHNKNVGNIDNANAYINNLLNYVRIQIPEPAQSSAEIAKATAKSTEELLTKAIELNEKHKGEIAAQAARIKELEKIIEQQKIKESEFSTAIDYQKTRLDKVISDFQTQFSTAQENRSESFTKSAEQFQEKFTSQSDGFKTKFETSERNQKTAFDKHLESTKKETREHLDHLNLRKSEVDKIFGAIGSASLSGNFKDTADKEHKAANLLRWISLALMAGMITIAIITYKASLDHPEIDWKLFGFRLATTIIIAVPAVYAAQESSKHRERERKNRKLQIELATIDSYLSLLPKEEQDKIKADLTGKFFGTEEVVEKTDDVTKHALFDVLKSAVNNLTKAK